jgi:hypothetical protein
MTSVPRVAVWTGAGASYSWIWWADLLEDLCWLEADFVSDPIEMEGRLERADLLLVGGGDVGTLRRTLDWRAIEAWIRSGGRLVTTCAGAYLLRDWADASIANAAISIPDRASSRAWTECEDGIVVHPVRGPVSLMSEGGASFSAPIYGGPVFREPEGEAARVEARYAGVTRGAEWLLADHPQLLEGTPAVISVSMGSGLAVLSGPHLEHPDHSPAHLWLAGVLGWEPGPIREGQELPRPGTDTRGEEVVRRLASVRGRAATMADVSWRSGEKVWNGERVAGFADAIIPRARTLAHWGWGPRGRAGGLLPLLEGAVELLGAQARPESWDRGFSALSQAGTVLMDAYFASRRAGMSPPPRRARVPPRILPEGGFNAPEAPRREAGR